MVDKRRKPKTKKRYVEPRRGVNIFCRPPPTPSLPHSLLPTSLSRTLSLLSSRLSFRSTSISISCMSLHPSARLFFLSLCLSTRLPVSFFCLSSFPFSPPCPPPARWAIFKQRPKPVDYRRCPILDDGGWTRGDDHRFKPRAAWHGMAPPAHCMPTPHYRPPATPFPYPPRWRRTRTVPGQLRSHLLRRGPLLLTTR